MENFDWAKERPSVIRCLYHSSTALLLGKQGTESTAIDFVAKFGAAYV